MEVVRDLIRDLVGIIFPGGLLVCFTLWLFFGIIIIFVPSSSLTILAIGDNSISVFALLIFSYVAGQFLRLKRLDDLEEKCTRVYRKKDKPNLDNKKFKEAAKKIDQEEAKYYAGQSSLDDLKSVYRQYNKKFGFWEKFPYPYLLKGRRLERLTTNYNEFFENYDRHGITKYRAFFNFCKTVIYQYSPSLKEEVIRQESLVRLFAGIYYVIKYGKIVSLTTGLLHLAMIISSYRVQLNFLAYSNRDYSYEIVIVSVFAYFIFIYLNNEILDRLRVMRAKEVDLAYDGFYVISKEAKLDL